MMNLKHALLLALTILVMGALSSSALAEVVIKPVGTPQYDSQGNAITVTFDVKNLGSSIEFGLVELQPELVRPFIIYPVQTNCDPNNKQDVHKDFVLASGQTDRGTLTSFAVSPGTYKLYLQAWNKCCAEGGCYPLSSPVYAGFVDVPKSQTPECISHATAKCYLGNVYWYNSCGSKEEIKQVCNIVSKCEGSEDSCRITPPPADELSGSLFDLSVPSKVNVSQPIRVMGSFRANTAGTYYLEAGLIENSFKPLQTVSASSSACDGSRNYAGSAVNLKGGESINFDFTVRDYNKAGRYEVVIGAYNGCSAALGNNFKIITSDLKQIQIGQAEDSGPSFSVKIQLILMITLLIALVAFGAFYGFIMYGFLGGVAGFFLGGIIWYVFFKLLEVLI